MNRIDALKPVFVNAIPRVLEPGMLYISEKYRTASHLCCCGCGTRVATPLKPAFWSLTKKHGKVSFHPSIGNWSLPCQSHYWIRSNSVVWAGALSKKRIEAVRARDNRDQDAYYNQPQTSVPLWRRIIRWIFRQ
jgi:hypothetical protein